MNKASGSDGIPVEVFQTLKDDTMKVLHSICQQIWKAQQWPQDWKRSIFIPIPKKGNAKECSTTAAAAKSLQLCPTLCDPMDCSTPGFPVLHHLPELAQTHVHQVGDAIQPSHPVTPFSSCLQSFPASGSFPTSQLFTLGGQSIEVSASVSVLPMNIQD